MSLIKKKKTNEKDEYKGKISIGNTTQLGTKQHHQWSPYVINGGTAVAVGGKGFCIVAADTRCSRGYSILSRKVPKIFKLTSKCCLSIGGMQAEQQQLTKVLNMKIKWYEYQNKKEIKTTAIAQMLGNTLYYKRFFPYYTFNVLGGLDENGDGHTYGYDAIGSFEEKPYVVTGSGSALITSLFDNQIGFKTHVEDYKELSLKETLQIVKDAYTCCGERDIYTGDKVIIHILTPGNMETEEFQLKED